MQQARALQFGGDHGLKGLAVLVQQETVARHPGRMDHRADGAAFPPHALQNAAQAVLVRDIARIKAEAHAATPQFAQSRNAFRRALVRGSIPIGFGGERPPVQQGRPAAQARDKLSGQRQRHGAESSGYQHAFFRRGLRQRRRIRFQRRGKTGAEKSARRVQAQPGHALRILRGRQSRMEQAVRQR